MKIGEEIYQLLQLDILVGPNQERLSSNFGPHHKRFGPNRSDCTDRNRPHFADLVKGRVKLVISRACQSRQHPRNFEPVRFRLNSISVLFLVRFLFPFSVPDLSSPPIYKPFYPFQNSPVSANPNSQSFRVPRGLLRRR